VGIVLDAKSKDFGPDDEVVAYDEHLMQLAAYRLMVWTCPMLGAQTCLCLATHPGLMKVVEWPEEELVKRAGRCSSHC
jgi:hypothetical protein